MDTPNFADAIDLAITKLRSIPDPGEGSPMSAALIESREALTTVLGLVESGGTVSAIDRARKAARGSMATLVLTAENTAFGKIDEVKAVFSDAESALTNW